MRHFLLKYRTMRVIYRKGFALKCSKYYDVMIGEV